MNLAKMRILTEAPNDDVFDIDKEIGFHSYNKSGLYDDMEGYVDELQNEKDLPDNKVYVVTYFKLCDDCSGLEQLVDFGITKQQIIDNVVAQKYVEGADYFIMEQLQKVIWFSILNSYFKADKN